MASLANYPSSEENKRPPRISYRTEYRHRNSGELLYEKTAESFTALHHTNDAEDPAFELVRTYKMKPLDSAKPKNSGASTEAEAAPPMTHAAPSYRVNIHSIAIINALQSVVKYYPSQDLTGDVITVEWPYPVLVHHYEELAAFRDECAAKDPSQLCVREKDAPEHITWLLEFLDKEVMPDVRAEQERNKRGLMTFEHLWVPCKPGVTVAFWARSDPDEYVRVIRSLRGGVFVDPPDEWIFDEWSLDYDGYYLGRVMYTTLMGKFDGESEMGYKRRVLDYSFEESDPGMGDGLVYKKIENGKKFWALLQKQCRYYRGKSGEFPYNEVEGLVMADLQSYYRDFYSMVPALMDMRDLRNWNSDCDCALCKERKSASGRKIAPLFETYNDVDVDSENELTPHQYLLCPDYMKAFVFRTRTWEKLHVGNFFEPDFDETMINSLVMNTERKALLKALSKSFARRDKHDRLMASGMWSADFVKGKGSGLIFLLHGKPGVGKTCTAECIAAFTRRPLMILTTSDIGTTINDVEGNLTRNFKTARSWGAVLLIDEADVFMERRTAADLERNALVAAFLRALESYDGILFLTTNRVGAFDDAFISRIHVQMYYPDFTDDQRQQVWKTFMDKLARERGGTTRLNIDAKEYIRSAEMRALQWNGREIRNAFQTAVALAEYDAETDEEGKVVVTDSHFRAVVELSKDFKDYLSDLHKGDEAKRAERKYERLDTFLTPTKT